MNPPNEIVEQSIKWRRFIHAHPELGFEEHQTSQMIATILSDLGLEVHTRIAKTGVVGILKKGNSGKSIGIRADIDALPMEELNKLPYRSKHPNKMHACGHDGHTAILLGAATYLAKYSNFNGTVYFIFQPAEENLGGGKAMVEDGLFERFDIDEIYGLHNWPGKKLGEVCINDDALMASFDIFDIKLIGKGGHAAIPEGNCDPIIAAAELITSLQSIVARKISPVDSAVLSITQILGGDTYNIIPESVSLKGTVRALNESTRLLVKQKIIECVHTLPTIHGVKGQIDYQERYPATINNSECAQKIRKVSQNLFGNDKVFSNVPPTMASEDFSFMLHHKKRAYIWLGVDDEDQSSPPLHNPYYNFNDKAIPLGIQLWIGLVEQTLNP